MMQDWQKEQLKVATGVSEPKREWVGLTDVEYSILSEQFTGADGIDVVDYGRAIEAKLKEKNTCQ